MKVVCNLAQLGICNEQYCEHKELHEPVVGLHACHKPCGRNRDAGCFNPF